MPLHHASDAELRRLARSSASPLVTERKRPLVLIADPDPAMAGDLGQPPAGEELDIVVATDGAEALFLAGRLSPDALVVSSELPGVPSEQLIRVIRANQDIPVLVGVSPGQTKGVDQCLAAGGSALLGRPYSQSELYERLGVHLEQARTVMDQEALIHFGPLILDPGAVSVTRDGRPIRLTLREFELLHFFLRHAGRPATIDQIRSEVWGARGETATVNTIAVHVGKLRTRLGNAVSLSSIRGVGYRLTLAQEGTTSVDRS